MTMPWIAETAPHAGGEIRRNWKMLIACIAGCGFCSAGISTYSIGPFVKPLEAAMGWGRSEVQAAILFGMGLGAIGGIVTALALERFGGRPVALFGLLSTGLCFLLVSQSHSLGFFYACYGLNALIGAAGGFVTWSRAITTAFDRHRGLALAMALSGTGISAFALPPILVAVIAAYGWRVGYLALSCAPLLIALPLAFVFFHPKDGPRAERLRPAAPAPELTGLTATEAVKNYRFWLLLVSIIALYLGICGIIPNLIPSLTDDGIPAERAALAQSSFAVALVAGRLLVGWLVDRFWAPAVAAIVLTPPTIGCLILISHPALPAAMFASALVGMAAGAELDLLAMLTSRYFGTRYFGRVYGLLYAAVALAGGVGPMAFARIYEISGNYHLSFEIAAVLFAIGGPILLLLGRYPVFPSAGGARQPGRH